MATTISGHDKADLRRKILETAMSLIECQSEAEDEAKMYWANSPHFQAYWKGWRQRGAAIRASFGDRFMDVLDRAAEALIDQMKLEITDLRRKAEKRRESDRRAIDKATQTIVDLRLRNEMHRYRHLILNCNHKFFSKDETSGRSRAPITAYYLCNEKNVQLRFEVVAELAKVGVHPEHVTKLPEPVSARPKRKYKPRKRQAA